MQHVRDLIIKNYFVELNEVKLRGFWWRKRKNRWMKETIDVRQPSGHANKCMRSLK